MNMQNKKLLIDRKITAKQAYDKKFIQWKKKPKNM